MKKIFISFFVVVFVLSAVSVKAQSLDKTAWKTYFSAINDTLVWHFQGDSSFVTSGSTNDVVVKSHFRLQSDTLFVTDYDGQYACPGAEGKYKMSISADSFILNVIADPCDNRAQNIEGLRWTKVGAQP